MTDMVGIQIAGLVAVRGLRLRVPLVDGDRQEWVQWATLADGVTRKSAQRKCSSDSLGVEWEVDLALLVRLVLIEEIFLKTSGCLITAVPSIKALLLSKAASTIMSSRC